MRFATIAFAVIMFSLAANMFNDINNCYCGIYCGKTCSLSSNLMTFTPSGHKIVDMEITPILSWTEIVKDSSGQNINTSNKVQMEALLTNMTSYSSPSSSIVDLMGFLGFVLPGLRMIVNTLFLPLFGLPSFLANYLYIPVPINYMIGTLTSILMVLGIIEFTTGRQL